MVVCRGQTGASNQDSPPTIRSTTHEPSHAAGSRQGIGPQAAKAAHGATAKEMTGRTQRLAIGATSATSPNHQEHAGIVPSHATRLTRRARTERREGSWIHAR